MTFMQNKQEAFEKCGAHSPREPPHAQSAGVATGTVARRHAHRCPRRRRQRRQRQRQRVTEETAMAPWNGSNNTIK